MKLRTLSYCLIAITTSVLLGIIWLAQARHGQPLSQERRELMMQARRPARQTSGGGALPTPQVVMGTPQAYTPPPESSRYTYRNDFPANRSDWLPLYLIDTATGQETRLGNGSGPAVFGVLDDHYLVWYFAANVHAYNLANGQDTLIAARGSSDIHPLLSGDWLAFGLNNGDGSQEATLYAANLQTQEVITLTRNLPAGDDKVRGYFGISDDLAAWYAAMNTIVIYDLAAHRELTRLTAINTIFNEPYLDVYDLSPGETIVTWSRDYAYDLVTRSYFRLGRMAPPDWDNAPVRDMSRIQERNRLLSWTIYMRDGSQRHIRAQLLDATPSTAPCVEGQNLVKNGDLEDIAAHNVWQQSDSPSDLIVNDLPPNSPQAGQWAIRLGRYSNAQQAIQQTLNIPSNVKHITLAFDVRASSWDIWGGDQLQVDLIDPVTNQSVLATPVQWTNRQLANGGWIPLQVDIQDWPGIDTPLYLVFRATTDWAFPTDFTIDNIRFLTACQ
ncbi:MAG: hypothetical protein U0350_42795 [Caldilineaceae bacterium]